MAELNVAILIDYENVGAKNLLTLFDQVSDVGRVIVKRAYADWSLAGKQAKEQLLDLGIEAVQNFHAVRSSKNSSDIRLAIDAVELLYGNPVDVFVIVSADSDFVSLVAKLRAGGKVVIGAGRKSVVSPTLVRACDRYIFLDQPVEAGQITKGAIPQPALDQPTLGLLVRAVRASSDEEGKVVAAKLHNTMLRIDPGFDFKALGFKSFGQFLKAADTIDVSKPKRAEDFVVELH